MMRVGRRIHISCHVDLERCPLFSIQLSGKALRFKPAEQCWSDRRPGEFLQLIS